LRRRPAPLLNNYLDNVEAYCNKQKMRDPYSDEEREPDEALMKSIEEQIGIGDHLAQGLPRRILIRISNPGAPGQQFDYTSHERLKELSRRSSSPTCATL